MFFAKCVNTPGNYTCVCDNKNGTDPDWNFETITDADGRIECFDKSPFQRFYKNKWEEELGRITTT